MSTAGYRLKDQYTRVSCVFYTLAMNILKLKTEKTIPLMIASKRIRLGNKYLKRNKACTPKTKKIFERN